MLIQSSHASQRVIESCAVLLAALLASCSESPKTQTPSPDASEVTVSAAASTKEAMESLAAKFRHQAQVNVTINPGPSTALANQILAGAPVDLFLSANRQLADQVASEADQSAPLLTNKLVLVVPQGNPAQIARPEDLESPQVTKIALAGESVPAGMYADQALKKLELLEKLVAAGKIARGQDVRSALAYVERREAEAGIVYSTDVRASQSVEVVYEFDPTLHDEIAYVLVLTKRGAANSGAKKLFEFLQSPEAGAEFLRFGFERLK